MQRLFGFSCIILALFLLVDGRRTAASQKGDPKYTISDVMKKAHGGKAPLLTKFRNGKATPEEAKDLLEMYEALAKNKPPQGDSESWNKRTKALIEGAKLYACGKKDEAIMKLNDATNCKACHSAHRG